MNPKSIIFLLILISIVLFMVGLNLGKQIERVDKTYMSTPSPTSVPKPTPTPEPVAFSTYYNKDCGVSFLYPTKLKKTKEATLSATLIQNSDVINVSCNPTEISDFQKKQADFQKGADQIYNNRKIPVYKINDHSIFQITNTINGKIVLFETSDNFTDLILRTLEFSR
ncbi:MAG TPA: hypothetical protein VK338_05910 [Candidatus Nitrosocosmicus sp.]|nr:hypothetical protein [Candidatus Nitrosocosmicus sp.]